MGDPTQFNYTKVLKAYAAKRNDAKPRRDHALQVGGKSQSVTKNPSVSASKSFPRNNMLQVHVPISSYPQPAHHDLDVRSFPTKSSYTPINKISLAKLYRDEKVTIRVGSYVICAKKKGSKRKVGEVGIVRDLKDNKKKSKPVEVEWSGYNSNGVKLSEGSRDWSKCTISAYTAPKGRRRMAQREFSSHHDSSVTDKPVVQRRRMAQREFSSRRDSPVMVRLLEEIIAAQDK